MAGRCLAWRLIACLVAAVSLASAATASGAVEWSPPRVLLHGATLRVGASNAEGRLAVVYAPQAPVKDYRQAGLRLIEIGSDGRVARTVDLTDSPTAQSPGVAVAGDGTVVVAWRDGGANGGPSSLWTEVVSPTGAASGPVELSSDESPSLTGPEIAVGAGARGDAAVSWVDAQSGRVLVSVRPPGGVFAAPVDASSAGSGASDPALIVGPTGRISIVWRPYLDAGTGSPLTTGPMAVGATAAAAGPFSAPMPVLTGPADSYAQGLTLRANNAGQALASAVIPPDPSQVWSNPDGSTLAAAVSDATGAFAPQLQVGVRNASDPGWALSDDGTVLEADGGPSGNPPTVQGLTTAYIDPTGHVTTEQPVQLTTPGLVSVATADPAFDSRGDAIVVFTINTTMQAGGFGNPTSGSIVSVVRPAQSTSWCQPQLISGLMSPWFGADLAFDRSGGGVAAYQQTPWGDIAVSFMRPDPACPPSLASAPITVTPTINVDRGLRTATAQVLCIAATRCSGRLRLLDTRRHTLGTGALGIASRATASVRLSLTLRVRNLLHHRSRIPVIAVIGTGPHTTRTVPQPLTLQRMNAE